jgi:predicted RecA/RadA family phage recombinase
VATNFVKEADTVTFLAPSGGIVSGAGAMFGNIFGVAMYTAAAGVAVEAGVEGEWILPKPNSVTTFAQGAPVFWDDTAKLCKASATGYFQIGVATVAAGVSPPRPHIAAQEALATGLHGANRGARRQWTARTQPPVCFERGGIGAACGDRGGTRARSHGCL